MASQKSAISLIYPYLYFLHTLGTLEETPFCVDGENRQEFAKTAHHYKDLKMQTAESQSEKENSIMQVFTQPERHHIRELLKEVQRQTVHLPIHPQMHSVERKWSLMKSRQDLSLPFLSSPCF